jgi:hypothetical protein
MPTTLSDAQVTDIKNTVDELADKVKAQLNEAGLSEGGRRRTKKSKRRARKTRRSV